MVTKAELEAELAELKREMAAREATQASREDAKEAAASDTAPDSMRDALSRALQSHGIDPSDLDLDGLWQQISGEAEDLMQKRPALAAIAIFALGFILGRVSK